jgi:hypothetical protein
LLQTLPCISLSLVELTLSQVLEVLFNDDGHLLVVADVMT